MSKDKGKLVLLSEDDHHPMQSKGIDSEDEPKEASGESRKLKKARSAQVHNFTERIRRRRLKEKMKCLQELVPNCSRRDKASVLDDAIKYIKNLQYQLQMMSMSAQGYAISHVTYFMQSPMHHRPRLPNLPTLPDTTRWGDYETGNGMGISTDLPTSPASAASAHLILDATPELFSVPTPQAWELPSFRVLGGISEDHVTIPSHDFLESCLPLSSSSLVPFLEIGFPLAEARQVPITSDESSSFFSC